MDWRDGVALAGVALICYGLWLIYPPAAYIAGGGALVGLSALSARRRAGAQSGGRDGAPG